MVVLVPLRGRRLLAGPVLDDCRGVGRRRRVSVLNRVEKEHFLKGRGEAGPGDPLRSQIVAPLNNSGDIF